MQAKTFLTLNFTDSINSLGVDCTVFYPFFSALFTLPGWPVEVGARLASLIFSVALFLAIVGIGRRFATTKAVTLGLLIIAFNAVLIPLSFSVLTEPSYIAVVYLGFWLFISQYDAPGKVKGLLLGLLFGLAFLDRTEGIVFLAAIPAMQFLHYRFFRKGAYGLPQFAGWFLLFVAGFGLVALPQVWWVSHKMGTVAINGRQAWMAIIDNPDGKSLDQKIYGLDYSPKEVNLAYVQSHPEAFRELSSPGALKQQAKGFVANFEEIYNRHSVALLGPLGLIFFGFGFVSLLKTGRYYELCLVLGFVGVALIPPLINFYVLMRYVAIVGPLMMLIEGIGIVYAAEALAAGIRGNRLSFHANSLAYALLALLLMCSARPIWRSIHTATPNWDYSQNDFKEPLAIMQRERETMHDSKPRVAARKSYFTYMADVENVAMPYTGYDGLVRYFSLNTIDFLFLESRNLKGFPFLEAFGKADSADFERLYTGKDSFGGSIELYRFKRSTSAPETTGKAEGAHE